MIAYDLYRVRRIKETTTSRINNQTLSDFHYSFERLNRITWVEHLSWSDNLNNPYLAFDFTTNEEFEVGEWVELYEPFSQITVFYGIITTKTQSKHGIYSYSGFDTGFYLEKNKITKQFEDKIVSDAIIDACKEIEVEAGDIINIQNKATKIFKNNSVSDILKELVEIARKDGFRRDCYFDCTDGRVNLLEYIVNNDLRGYIANIYTINSTNSISSYTIKSSMEDLKNKVLVITSPAQNKKESKPNIEVAKEGNNNIDRYGLLQEVIEGQQGDNYEQIAINTLESNNQLKNEIELSVLGDFHCHRGIVTYIEDEETQLNGNYLIMSTNHNIIGTKETVRINIRKYDI